MRHWVSGTFVSLLLVVSVAGQDAGIVGVWEHISEEGITVVHFREDGVFIGNRLVSGSLVSIIVGSYEAAGNTVTVVATVLELIDETAEGSAAELDPDAIYAIGADKYRVLEEDSVDRSEFSVSGDELAIGENLVLTRSVRTLIAPPGLTGTVVQELTWGMVKNAMAP